MAVEPCKENNAFERAFQDLLLTAKSKPKKHLSKFLIKCQNAIQQVSLKSVAGLIDQAENASLERNSRKLTRKILEPMVDSLKAYDKVISTLCSADPMPTALIWGALKVVIDCTDRFANLFAIIKTQLSALRDRIEDIQEYESLFGKSPELQRDLFKFYKDVLRFWSRVDKECSRPSFLSVVQATIPLTMTKIRNVITEIEEDVDRIRVTVQTIDLRESKEERMLNSQTRQAQQEAEIAFLHGRIREWLTPSAHQFSSDAHLQHVKIIVPGTLEWLRDDLDVQDWSSAASKTPILWVTAAPGFGKTVACSKVIEQVTQDYPDAAVCYHFYKNTELHPSREVLRSFASQLLDKISIGALNISALRQSVQNNPEIIKNIVSLIELILSEAKMVFFFIDGLDEATSGDDKLVGDTTIVVDTLISLCSSYSGKVRFWCSSQSTAQIKELMSSARTINLDGRNIDDVSECLHQALHHRYRGEDVDDEDLADDICDLAARLGQKARGSFMWAVFMRHDIESAESPAEISAIVESNVPDGLDEYFEHILHRIEKSKWPLASLLLSLICFARRPLRVSELREAVAILRSKDRFTIDRTQRPFPREMEKILLPLIQPHITDSNEKVYRVCHTTLRDFLHRHPNVLCADPAAQSSNIVSGEVLGQACLRYLRQNRFSKRLTWSHDSWQVQDGSGQGSTLKKNPFTTYAAKYWSTHLNMVAHADRLPLYRQISDFVRSPNFWTCLQIQSLFVIGQFSTYNVQGQDKWKFKKRFLPHWYIHEPGNTMFGELRTFLHEWSYFLADHNSQMSCHGEIDRCLIAGLGPKNFLAGMEQRYNNFTFSSQDNTIAGDGQFEACSADGRLLSFMEARYNHHDDQFEIQVSQINTRKQPLGVLSSPLTWNMTTDAIDWLPYTCLKHVRDRSCVCIGKTQFAGMSSCGEIIRVANQMWRWNRDKQLVPLRFRAASLTGLLIEHVECKDDLIFITSRRKVAVKRKIGHAMRRKAKQEPMDPVEADRNLVAKFYETHLGRDQLPLEGISVESGVLDKDNSAQPPATGSVSSTENIEQAEKTYISESDLTPESESDSSVVNEFETEQYWSDASTHIEENGLLADRFSIHPAAAMTGEETSTSTEPTDSSAGEEETSSDGTKTEDEHSDPAIGTDSDSDRHQYFQDLLDGTAMGNGEGDSSEGFGIESSDEEGFQYAVGPYTDFLEEYATSQKARPVVSDDDSDDQEQKRQLMTTKLVATLRVYRDDGNATTPIFKFNLRSARPVCNSPPAIHPQKSLVVWPITESLLLFVDYAKNTYFRQTLRPPKGSRFVTIRCHFSNCGSYLHIAALKRQVTKPGSKTTGQHEDQKRKTRKQKNHHGGKSSKKSDGQSDDQEPSSFSLLVLTYALSSRKTSYSPPRLIYRQAVSLPMMKYPLLTYVWAATELFASHSGVILHVFRIKLFENGDVGRERVNSIAAQPPQALNSTTHSDLASLSPKATVKSTDRDCNNDFQIMVLEQPIHLPWSARKRPIYFIHDTFGTATAIAERQLHSSHEASTKSRQKHLMIQEKKIESTTTALVIVGPEKPPIPVHRTPELIEHLQQHFDSATSTAKTNGKSNVFESDDDDDANANAKEPAPEHEYETHDRRIIGVTDCLPMFGILLDEQKDLGGWKVYNSTEKISRDQNIGVLDDMMELFDPEDDCDDVEPWML